MTDQTSVRRTTTTTIKFGYKTTAGKLRAALDGVPDEAEIKVTKWEGDQREPTQTTIHAEWNLAPPKRDSP
jgi:hypothetical protein